MGAFSPKLTVETSSNRGTYYIIEGLPATLRVGPFRAQSELYHVPLALAGVRYVICGSPPRSFEYDFMHSGIKWILDDSWLQPQQLMDYLEASNTPLLVSERCRPLNIQVTGHDFDLLMCNAHCVGCALLMGKGVLVYCKANVAHAAILTGAVLVLIGCDHEQIADMFCLALRQLGLEELTTAQLKPILAHVRRRSIGNCRLDEMWNCAAE